MTALCNKYFHNELAALQNSLIGQPLRPNPGLRRAVTCGEDGEPEEEDDDETQRESDEDEEDEDNKASNQYSWDIDDEWDDHVTLVAGDRRRPSTGTAVAG